MVAHLLRLPGPQRHHGVSSGAAAALAHGRPRPSSTRRVAPGAACWFTEFDLAQGYHQVRPREADWWESSFRSRLG